MVHGEELRDITILPDIVSDAMKHPYKTFHVSWQVNDVQRAGFNGLTVMELRHLADTLSEFVASI